MSKSGLRSSVLLRFVLSRKKWRPRNAIRDLSVRQYDFHVAFALERNVLKGGLFLKKIVLHDPFRRQNHPVSKTQAIAHIQNAAHLHVG